MNLVISIGGDLADFINAKLASGDYASSEDVVREARRLMKQLDHGEAEKLRWLREAWREGVESGDAGEIDFDELKEEARKRFASRRA